MREGKRADSLIGGPRRRTAPRARGCRPEFRPRPLALATALVLSALLVLVSAPGGFAGTATAAQRPLTIAALGDSYSSGEGTPPFEAVMAGCRRSTGAWPRLLPTLDPPATTVLHAACSGATTKALTEPQKDARPQLDQLRGLATRPDVVTLTIGGNDAGFSKVMFSCVAWKCFWNGDDRRRRTYVREELPALLVASYNAVKAAAPHSRVVVVGYPDVFPRSQRGNTCPWLENSERRQLVSLNNTLNRTIRNAASDAGVEFVSTARALRGHEMCTKDSWVNPVSLFGASRDLSAHPTRAGQEAMARTIHDALFDER